MSLSWLAKKQTESIYIWWGDFHMKFQTLFCNESSGSHYWYCIFWYKCKLFCYGNQASLWVFRGKIKQIWVSILFYWNILKWKECGSMLISFFLSIYANFTRAYIFQGYAEPRAFLTFLHLVFIPSLQVTWTFQGSQSASRLAFFAWVGHSYDSVVF